MAEKAKRSYTREFIVFVGLAALLIAAILISLSIGRYNMPVSEILEAVLLTIQGQDINTNQNQAVLFAIRLPRLFLSLLAGAALAASGAAYQGLFKNPMVSPDILGVSSGASIGACIAILFSLGSLEIQGFAFATGCLAIALVLAISSAASRNTGGSLLILILAGIVISSLCSAITSIIKYVAPPETALP